MKRVVIIGGSYGGIRALETLSGEKVEVTLIDQHAYHYLQTESYDLVASKKAIEETIIYLPSLVQGIDPHFTFVCDKAVAIENNCVIGEKAKYNFDYLLVTVGAVTKFPEGFDQKSVHSFGVKSLQGSVKIKHFFETELLERLEPLFSKKKFRIVIVGGGLSGVEIATEMQHYFNRYMRRNALSCGTIEIILVSRSLLNGFSPGVQQKVSGRLKHLGVKHLPHHVSNVAKDHAYLDNGESVTFDFIVYTGGIEPAPFISALPYPKNEQGFLAVDEYLRLDDHIFAAGDCAVLYDHKGRIAPPTAQSAEQSAQIAAKNILSDIARHPLQKSVIKMNGIAIALGGKHALIVTPFGFSFGGIFGFIVKKTIELSYKIPLRWKAQRGYDAPCNH